MKIFLSGTESKDHPNWGEETCAALVDAGFIVIGTPDSADYIVHLLDSKIFGRFNHTVQDRINRSNLSGLIDTYKEKLIVVSNFKESPSNEQNTLRFKVCQYYTYLSGKPLAELLARNITTYVYLYSTDEEWMSQAADAVITPFLPLVSDINEADIIIWQLNDEQFKFVGPNQFIQLKDTPFSELGKRDREKTYVFARNRRPNWREARAFPLMGFGDYREQFEYENLVKYVQRRAQNDFFQ